MGTEASKVAADSSHNESSGNNQLKKPTKIGLLGGTGKVGGFVLEEALARGYHVRALVRSPEKIAHLADAYPKELRIIQGSSTDEDAVLQLLVGVEVVISALSSPNNNTLVMTPSARVLVSILQKVSRIRRPRVVWMTSIGVNDAVAQGHQYGCSKSFLPSCKCCCGYGLMGCLIFNWLVPKVIGSDLWEDMGTSEDIFTAEGGEDIMSSTVIVRPTNMHPVSEHLAFSEEWRKDGGTNTQYITRRSDESPPNMWITRRAVAAFLLDLVGNKDHDGDAVSLFQGEEKVANAPAGAL